VIVLLASLAVILVVTLRRAPVATVLAGCALAAAIHAGAVSLPGAIGGPIGHLSADVRHWQARQSAKLVCATAEMRALEAEDQLRLQALDGTCTAAAR
jgi:hypothetical protein